MGFGLGIFIYPSLEIKGFEECEFVSHERYIALEDSIDSKKLIITTDGFIGILSEDVNKSIKIINTIMSLILLIGGRALITNRQELIKFRKEENEDKIHIVGIPVDAGRNLFLLEKDIHPERGYRYPPMQTVSKQQIEEIIKYVKLTIHDEPLITHLHLLIEAYSLMSSESYPASFLLSWMTIENYIDNLWSGHISSITRNSEQRETLENDRSWTVYNKLEVLEMLKIISKEDLDIFSNLRKMRNKVAHNLLKPDEENCRQCLTASYKLAKEKMRKLQTDVQND